MTGHLKIWCLAGLKSSLSLISVSLITFLQSLLWDGDIQGHATVNVRSMFRLQSTLCAEIWEYHADCVFVQPKEIISQELEEEFCSNLIRGSKRLDASFVMITWSFVGCLKK